MVPVFVGPSSGIFNSGGKFSSLDAAKLEGEVAHHLPQNAFNRTIGLSRSEGPALGMTGADHALTRTFAGRGAATMKSDFGLNGRQRMFLDIQQIRGTFGTRYNSGLLKSIDYSKTLPQFQKQYKFEFTRPRFINQQQ